MDDIFNDHLQDYLQYFRRKAPSVLQAGYEALDVTPPFLPKQSP